METEESFNYYAARIRSFKQPQIQKIVTSRALYEDMFEFKKIEYEGAVYPHDYMIVGVNTYYFSPPESFVSYFSDITDVYYFLPIGGIPRKIPVGEINNWFENMNNYLRLRRGNFFVGDTVYIPTLSLKAYVLEVKKNRLIVRSTIMGKTVIFECSKKNAKPL